MKKYIFALLISLVFVGVLVTPVLAQTAEKCLGGAAGQKCGQTAVSNDSLIASLQTQIANLTEQLNKLLEQRKLENGWHIDPIEPDCFDFEEDFGVGDLGKRANNFINLGSFLTRAGFSFRGSKGGYDQVVINVVKQFQAKYGIKQTGYVGPLTRGKLNQLYGCKKPPINNQAPVISGISGPTTLKVGEAGTWTVKITGDSGYVSYGVTWGDETVSVPNVTRSSAGSPMAHQTSKFTHIYNRAGTFSSEFTVINLNSDNQPVGQSAKASLTVVVTQTNQPQITVTSPNGGEQWMVKSVKDITWRWSGSQLADKVDLYLLFPPCLATGSQVCPAFSPQPIVLDKNIATNAVYNWIVGTDINNNKTPTGSFLVQVCPAGSQSNCDSSDQPFSILTPLINDAW